jgi:Protein of unknown function (DUF1592)/Protein of unknown function (DUF1585)/Protein of unknown function (DUF1587)/Protein of unknown function (DUF1588)/Planctomycete cytochrome C
MLAAVVFASSFAHAQTAPPQIGQRCIECHDKDTTKGGLDLTALSFDLKDPATRDRWVRIYDRVEKGEMPPKPEDLPQPERTALVQSLSSSILTADHADILAHGRGPLRRLNRDEYEQNLRDILQLPDLDIRDILPEDREGHRFNKTTAMLDMSRVQLVAYLDAAEAALRAAMATGSAPPPVQKYRAVGTDLFPGTGTFGNRESMFFARDGKAMEFKRKNDKGKDEPSEKDLAADDTIEMALFRSASWPYIGTPKHFTAKLTGNYKLRFSARAVLQQPGYVIIPAREPLPMTFRTRKPAGADIINEVHDSGGIIDIQPAQRVYETTVRLREGEAVEYSLLGLPMPLAMNPNGSGPSYRYPPFPEGGQPGIAVQWLEIEGPLESQTWPPPSHRVLFDDLGIEVKPQDPQQDARRLLRRFVKLAAREPIPDEDLKKFDDLIQQRLSKNAPFAEAMLAGYKAFLASGDFIYVREPIKADDHFAIASRLSHFLTNSRPDAQLMQLAQDKKLRDPQTLRTETDRLIASPGFDRFVKNFTDCWLGLRHIRRDDPDIRGAKTIRDLLALHTKSKTCAACHARFDPVGLALENFDILGGWRTNYRGLEEGKRITGIDRAGHDFSYTIATPVDTNGKLLDGRTFTNVTDLKTLLAANPRQLARNLLHQFTLYATGTPVRFSDRPQIESLLNSTAQNNYPIRDLLQALIQSPIFLGCCSDAASQHK